jgi:hypothetical protein
MGPSLLVKDYLNNLNHLESVTEKKLFRMRRREADHQKSRLYNFSKNSVDEDLLIGVSSNSPMRESMYLKETESSRNRA